MAISCVRNTKDRPISSVFTKKDLLCANPIIGGNWKMNLNAGDGADLAESIAEGLARGPLGAEVVMFPAFPYLALIADVRIGPPCWGPRRPPRSVRAFTGEVSLPMLRTAVWNGFWWVTRNVAVIGESNDIVREKLHAALNAGFSVICALANSKKSGKQAVNLK